MAEEVFSYVLDATAKVRLDVEAVNGTITVTGVGGSNEMKVDGVKQVWSSSQADADEYLDSLNVYADENLNAFLVNTEQPTSSDGRTFVVNYEIELPDGLEVMIVSANGAITVSSIMNDVAVINANGDITLDDIEGSVAAALGNGDIEAEVTLPLAGTLELAIGNGGISLSIPQSTSAEFSAEVGNGSISVMNLALQNEVTTNTSVRGTLWAAVRVRSTWASATAPSRRQGSETRPPGIALVVSGAKDEPIYPQGVTGLSGRALRRSRLGLVPLLLAAAAGSAGCFADIFGSDEGPAISEELFEYGLELAGEVGLVVLGKSGDVTITSAPGSDSVVIRAVLRVSADNPDDAEAGLSELWVDVDQSSSLIIVQTAQPSALDTRDFEIDYEISTPPFMMLSISNVAGDVTINGAGSELSIQIGSGNVTLNNTFAVTRVRVGNGSIDASVVLPWGTTVGISTGNGDIDLALPVTTSATILATAANGTVSVTNLDIDYEYRTENALAGTLGVGLDLGLIQLTSRNGGVALVGY